jgi:hypothetical protein
MSMSWKAPLLGLLWRFKNQLYWILGTIGLSIVWLAFIYLFGPNEVGTVATALATACLIALIQKHYTE